MLHLLYILAFTVLAFLAVRNLIRSLISVGMESQRSQNFQNYRGSAPVVPHPELLDETGRVVNEPLLVMRSFSVQEARHQLDSLYESSPSSSEEAHDEA
ncbi:MAG: DUF2973 domain-containing protein [Microcoleaceae cyanobacterium]